MSEPPRGDPFTLSRWSRLKRRAGAEASGAGHAAPAAVPDPGAPAPEVPQAAPGCDPEPRAAAGAPQPTPEGAAAARPVLPPVGSLTFDADFGAFLQPDVDESLKRAALRKLFADPRFNVMDGLDVYIVDYSKPDPLPPGMLEQLVSARHALRMPATEPDAVADAPGPTPGSRPDHDAESAQVAPPPSDVEPAVAAAMPEAAATHAVDPGAGDAIPAGPGEPGRGER